MLGSGRPFLVEIQNARNVPSEVSVKEIENKINNLEEKLVSAQQILFVDMNFLSNQLSLSASYILCHFQVGVRNLKVVGSEGWSLMREGEAEKQVTVWLLNYVLDVIVFLISFKDKSCCNPELLKLMGKILQFISLCDSHWIQME